MSQSRVDLEVFCKRNGTRGTVVAESNGTITIQTNGVNKVVTENTFKRWYTIVPQDKSENNTMIPMPGTEDPNWGEKHWGNSEESESEDELATRPKRDNPSGEVGIGLELRNKFIEIVKAHANQSLDFTYDEKNNRDVIKYNGKNVFECTTARRRFNVLCHSKALTPDNIKRANKVYPKEWGWVLNVKFVFTEMNQVPLMRSIITDSLFYRQKESTKDE